MSDLTPDHPYSGTLNERWQRLLDQPPSREAFHSAMVWAVVQMMHEPDGFWPDGEYRYLHDAEWHARVERTVVLAFEAATRLVPEDGDR